MSDMAIESGTPDVDGEDDDEEHVLAVSVSITEVDGGWHNATTMIPVDLLTPDSIAEGLIRCVIGAAAARGSTTLIALQQALMDWGRV